MIRQTLLAAALASGGLATAAAAEEPKEFNFGVISTEASPVLKARWEPLLSDLEKAAGFKVRAFYATDYAGVIEGMRFGKVQAAWFGNKSAMEAVDRAGGEIFVQSVNPDGLAGYYSLIIVNKDSPIQSLEDLLKNSRNYTFGNGDPNSTSGFLVPSYYVFAKNKVDPKTAFKRVINSNHETNALAVANKQVDAATNNTETLGFLEKSHPEQAGKIRVIWKSPVIPFDPIVWRKDLPEEVKAKVKTFFLDYGVKAASPQEVERQKHVLAALHWAPFRESSNRQLVPIRQLELFRDRTKVENDPNMAAAEKKAKLNEFDAKLAVLQKEQGS
jgi:phosphonate transport system substrate-binding protein